MVKMCVYPLYKNDNFTFLKCEKEIHFNIKKIEARNGFFI